jgi:hypothetical protein
VERLDVTRAAADPDPGPVLTRIYEIFCIRIHISNAVPALGVKILLLFGKKCNFFFKKSYIFEKNLLTAFYSKVQKI